MFFLREFLEQLSQLPVKIMDSYTDFAYLYDTFMEDVPYEEWCDILCDLIKQYNPNAKSVLDLGCGTGTLSYLLADRGYEVIGADISPDMLMVANTKCEAIWDTDGDADAGSDADVMQDDADADTDEDAHSEEGSVFFICQDMREIELAEPVDVVVSVCDSINYMLTDEDIQDTFAGVYDNLVLGGIFIFDFNTVYKYETVIGDTTIAENREDCSFIWENYYDPETRINEYDVTFFVKEESELFRRFTETHVQKGYTIDEMLNLVENAGFEILEFREAFDSFEESDLIEETDSFEEADASEEYGEYEESNEYDVDEEQVELDECEEHDVYEDIFDRDEDRFERVYLICRKPEK